MCYQGCLAGEMGTIYRVPERAVQEGCDVFRSISIEDLCRYVDGEFSSFSELCITLVNKYVFSALGWAVQC